MSDPADLITQGIVGLSGVGGGVLVYALGQRKQGRADRQDRSVRAAAELLVAIIDYRTRTDGMTTGRDDEQHLHRHSVDCPGSALRERQDLVSPVME